MRRLLFKSESKLLDASSEYYEKWWQFNDREAGREGGDSVKAETDDSKQSRG